MTAQDPYPHMQPPPPPVPQGHGYAQPQYQQQPAYPMHPVWPQMAVPAPVMIDGFYIVQPKLKPIPSGPAVGSLIAGIMGSIGGIIGLVGAAFNPWFGLTFFMFAALFGLGSVFLGAYAKRQVRAALGGVSGRGVATAGLIVGIVSCALALSTGLIALAVS